MKKWLTTLVITLLLVGCSSLQVQVDHIPDYDFSSLSTFSVVYTKKNDGKDFNRARIANILETYMKNKDYKSVDKSKADFYITMHLHIQKKSQVETNYETIGIRPIRYPLLQLDPILQPRGIRTPYVRTMEADTRVTERTYEYEEGKLILEIFDVNKNAVVWQGVAKDELSTGLTQEEKSAYIGNVIEELFKDFPPK